MKLSELANLTGGRISGNPDIEITGVAGINEARKGDITYLADNKRQDILATTASAVIVKEEIEELSSRSVPASMLVVDNPQFVFARTLEVFYVRPVKPAGISDKAVIGSNANFGVDVSIHPFASIGSNVTLGERVTISSGVCIGDNVSINNDSFIHANVTIRENVKIGEKVVIHSGTVIGSDGFGYVLEKGVRYKVPQVGGVIIKDNVEVGANAAIDRATLGNTIIGNGTKIDNLVHIAHNVNIGDNCVILGQVGISGSVEIGDGVILAGQVGIRDHIKSGKEAILSAQSGAATDIPERQIYSGKPAIPHKTWLRAQSIFSKLPDHIKRLRELEDNYLDIRADLKPAPTDIITGNTRRTNQMMNCLEIQEILPHRYPFLLVDRIIELEPKVKAIGLKNVTINEPFFQGHFPDFPIMPGVLTVEAMAQVAGILAVKSGAKGNSTYFMSIEKAKFRKPVVPGDQLRFEVSVLQHRNTVWKFSGKTFVDDKLVTEAEFTAMVSEQELKNG